MKEYSIWMSINSVYVHIFLFHSVHTMRVQYSLSHFSSIRIQDELNFARLMISLRIPLNFACTSNMKHNENTHRSNCVRKVRNHLKQNGKNMI